MDWLIEKRKAKFRFANEVAKLLGISKQRYCGIEKGRHKPTIPQAKAIGKLLGFDWWLLYEEEEEECSDTKSTNKSAIG